MDRSDSSLNRTASWIIIENSTGLAVAELYKPSSIAKVNGDKYTAIPVIQWLASVNREIRQQAA